MKTRALERCCALWIAPDGIRYASNLRTPAEAAERAPSGALLVFSDAQINIDDYMPLPVIESQRGKIVPDTEFSIEDDEDAGAE